MIGVKLTVLENAAKVKRSGYMEQALRCGTKHGDYLYMSPSDYQKLCDEYSPPGLGDKIARATKAMGIKPCGGCGRRQDKLNRLIPDKV